MIPARRAVAAIARHGLLWVALSAGACDASSRGTPTLDSSGLDDDAGEGADGSGVCTACGACEERLAIESALHVAGDFDYPDPPPAGGPHDACWAAWGVHDDELRAESWVHNLEHGGVVFLYRCPDACAEEVAELAALVREREQALLTPYGELPTRFGFVAWGARVTSDCHDLAAARAFYDAHVGRAPENVASDPPPPCP